MRPQKRTTLFLAGSLGVLVVILALPSRHGGDGLARPAPAQPTQTAQPRDDGALLAAQRSRAGELAWVRDPFVPFALGAPPRPSVEPVVLSRHPATAPILTGISIRGDDRRAVIDRRIVQEGDRLASGHTVARITARSVTLHREHDDELVLSLGEEP